MSWRGRVLFSLGSLIVCVATGCGSESVADLDPVADARGDTASDEDAGDDAEGDDTGTSATEVGGDGSTADAAGDARPSDAASMPSDSGGDTKLTCPNEEPGSNGSVPSATPLAGIDDCDKNGSTVKGVIAGATDIDYWTYHGKDVSFCVVDPTASTSSGVRVCIFPSCFGGQTEFKSCKKGTAADPVGGGIKGCCSDSSGAVEAEFGCPLVGTSDEADVYMRIDAPGATQCVPYEVAYHF